MRRAARRVEAEVELIHPPFPEHERGALAAYRAVLEVLPPTHPARSALERALATHQRQLEMLAPGFPSSTGVRAWKKMNAAIVRMAASIHPWAAVQLLSQGEQHALSAYEAAADRAPAKVREALRKVLASQRELAGQLQTLERSFAQPAAVAA